MESLLNFLVFVDNMLVQGKRVIINAKTHVLKLKDNMIYIAHPLKLKLLTVYFFSRLHNLFSEKMRNGFS